MSNKHECPRAFGLPDGPLKDFRFENKPDDGTCDFCGSMLGDEFMARLEAGDVTLVPTDKNYKVYVRNAGGKTFRSSYRTDSAQTTDQSQWRWTTRETDECKFYFQHLSEDQMRRFVDLYNTKRLRLEYPGYFYRMPFFMGRAVEQA